MITTKTTRSATMKCNECDRKVTKLNSEGQCQWCEAEEAALFGAVKRIEAEKTAMPKPRAKGLPPAPRPVQPPTRQAPDSETLWWKTMAHLILDGDIDKAAKFARDSEKEF
jgi:hypothetical protein